MAQGFDYSTSQLIEGFHLKSKHPSKTLNFKCLYVSHNHHAHVKDCIPVSVEEGMDSVDWADFVLFSSAGDMTTFDECVKKAVLDDSLRKKRVFIDGHDGDSLLVDPTKQLVYFKRECRFPNCNKVILSNIRSLVFGVYNYLVEGIEWHQDLDKDWENRDVDISFMAFGGSNPIRNNCVEVLQQVADKLKWNIECHVADDCQPIQSDKYHDILHRSKIGLSLPGAGYDTLRYWEVPGHGAVLLTMDLATRLLIRHPLESHRHHLCFENWDSMVEMARTVVSNKERWVQIRRAVDKHLIQFHTTIQRANEVLDICQEMV